MTDYTELLARLDKNYMLEGYAIFQGAAAAIRELTEQIETERKARVRIEALHKGLMQEQKRRTKEAERDVRTAHSLKDIALELKEAAEVKLATQIEVYDAMEDAWTKAEAKLAAVEAVAARALEVGSRSHRGEQEWNEFDRLRDELCALANRTAAAQEDK